MENDDDGIEELEEFGNISDSDVISEDQYKSFI